MKQHRSWSPPTAWQTVVVVASEQPAVERASDLGSKRALAARFARHPSAQLLVLSAVAVAAGRVALAVASEPTGAVTWADAVALAVGLALIGVVEWFAHRVLFHAPEESRRSRVLKTGASHRRHHADPTDLAWVLLHPRGARALMAAVAVLVAGWAVPAALVAGTSPIGPYLSALAIGWFAIANYEWTHLLAHSSYRPRSGRYRRLVRNHRVHHFRDPDVLYGISSNLGDRLLGTMAPSTPASGPGAGPVR